MDAKTFLNQLNEDPEYVRRKSQRDAYFDSLREADRVTERELVGDLARAGFPVRSVWDLVNTGTPYSGAIPVLIQHLQVEYPDRVREGIARALTVQDADGHFETLVDLFRTVAGTEYPRTKWALGNAIGKLLRSDRLPQATALLLDDSQSRESRRAIFSWFVQREKDEALLMSIRSKIAFVDGRD